MSTNPIVPESQPSTETLTINPSADAYAPSTLQHGLTRDADGHLQVLPELLAKLDPKTTVRANRLLARDRASEANSLVGCGHIYKVVSMCADGHEAEAAPICCNKPLLHEKDATAAARVAKFKREHPALYKHLATSSFQVLQFTIDEPSTSWKSLRLHTVAMRKRFHRMTKHLGKGHGWYWLMAFSDDPTTEIKFYVIHAGQALHYPSLEKLCHRFMGPYVHAWIRTFDGKDGDTQQEGMRIAHDGFSNYWLHLADGEELDASEAFCGEDLSVLYGDFRGFDAAVRSNDPIPMPICSVCGKPHVAGHHLPLMLMEEMGRRFDHIRPPTYGQIGGGGYRIFLTDPSPPPG